MKLTSTSEPASRCEMSKARPRKSQPSRYEAQQGREQPEHQRGTEKLRDTEHAHLGDRGLEHREQETPGSKLAEIRDKADRIGGKSGARGREAPGQEHAGDERNVEQELERSGELDQRQMAR